MKLSFKRLLQKLCCHGIWATTLTDNSRVVFTSFNGHSYSDNPRAISERLHELAPELEIIWINDGPSLKGAPSYINQVNKFRRYQYCKTLASAKVIVSNTELPYIPKKEGAKYIQTWHGDRVFKKVLYDCSIAGNPIYVPESKPGFCDLAIAGSDFGERQYQSAFRYNGEVLKIGTPRDDILLHVTDELIRQKKREIGVGDHRRYLLYAPTFRQANNRTGIKQNIQGINIQETLTALEKQYGGEWNCLLRAHPGVDGFQGDGVSAENVIDVSEHYDMADLLIISDALITDYSSCAGDYALLRRPIFLFQDDVDEYLEKERSFYFEMDDSPYLIVHSQEELNGLIGSTSLEKAALNCDDILRFYGTHESGDAANVVAGKICEYCGVRL